MAILVELETMNDIIRKSDITLEHSVMGLPTRRNGIMGFSARISFCLKCQRCGSYSLESKVIHKDGRRVYEQFSFNAISGHHGDSRLSFGLIVV